jgi:hypothetical protein
MSEMRFTLSDQVVALLDDTRPEACNIIMIRTIMIVKPIVHGLNTSAYNPWALCRSGIKKSKVLNTYFIYLIEY